ncbi:HPr kinase/phosphatase C-terminal domain-containing protein [Altererythrobacter lauratis]|uniref:HPr kinase/phosphatase C-terminal domain-containing protein n=1 Tax=Alteraurantiacibacter lauratis TaxID=2054627 RepID=A0ABV7EDS5_9SPHN
MSAIEVRQAGCVVVNGIAVLIEGASGTGKSALALALIDRGAALVGDDGVTLRLRDGRLWASPPPHTAGLIEIRNVGIARLPVAEGPVGLVLRLDAAAPRYVEEPEADTLLGVSVPCLSLFPDAAALPLRAEWAVRLYARRA